MKRFLDFEGSPPLLKFGKFDGHRLTDTDVDQGYLTWMLESLSLDSTERQAVKDELERRRSSSSHNEQRRGEQHRAETGPNYPRFTTPPVAVTAQTILEIVAAGRKALSLKYHPDLKHGDATKMLAVNCAADYLEKQAKALEAAK